MKLKILWSNKALKWHRFCCFLYVSVQAVCVIVAAIMQYFLMAAFCWMLVEGIYLYLFVVKVYNINDKMRIYHVMSWGILLIQLNLQYTVNFIFGSFNFNHFESPWLVCHFLIGFPLVMVAISLSIAAGKEGIQGYTSDKL